MRQLLKKIHVLSSALLYIRSGVASDFNRHFSCTSDISENRRFLLSAVELESLYQRLALFQLLH